MAYFDSDGVQIYFEEHGTGEPVVLVHGFASRAEHNWGLTSGTPRSHRTIASSRLIVAVMARAASRTMRGHTAARRWATTSFGSWTISESGGR